MFDTLRAYCALLLYPQVARFFNQETAEYQRLPIDSQSNRIPLKAPIAGVLQPKEQDTVSDDVVQCVC